MLRNLFIKNIVLINDLKIDFTNGLTVLTGETGSGKSILLEGLGLALGSRANFELIGNLSDKSIVTAIFTMENNNFIFESLNNLGIEVENDLILKRIISKDGKSRAFINDFQVGVNTLRKIGFSLVEIQGQFENHELLDSKTHLFLLDSYGKYQTLNERVKNSFLKMKNRENDLINFQKKIVERDKNHEELIESLKIINKINPKQDEEKELLQKRENIAISAKLIKTLDEVQENLDGPISSARKLIINSLSGLEKLDNSPKFIKPIINSLNISYNELDEAINLIINLSSSIDSTSKDLDLIDDRLFELRSIARRLGILPNELYKNLNKIKKELLDLEDFDNLIEQKKYNFDKARKEYFQLAQELSLKRKNASKDLDNSIKKELIPLKLDQAKFKTQVNRLSEDNWSQEGLDDVKFEVVTNPEQEFMPINKIASGGELARFLLAIKVVMSNNINYKLLIFDEVDSGVGGQTANAVGKRLKQLGEKNQTIVITHSPQVAALGKNHYIINKHKINGRIETNCHKISNENKIEEIARMLSGENITDQAREAAKTLLQKDHE